MRTGFAIEEFARRRGDFAIAGAAVAVEIDDGHTIRSCGIGLFGLGPTPLRATAAEATVTGSAVTDVAAEEVGHAAMEAPESVSSDLHADAGYRKRAGAAMVAAAWRRATQEAING